MTRIRNSRIPAGILTWCIMPFILHGQINNDFPRDTSFTVRSAALKIRNDFPEATPVREFENLQIHSERDVIYSSIQNRELHVDIFWPIDSDGRKLPGVICIHGGGWASGNKSHLVPLAQKLARNGYCAASVEYRLSPEAKYPAAVCDIKTALRWLRSNADKYNIDTTRIAVLGTSAGATIATLAGTTPGNPLFLTHPANSNVSDKVQAIVNIDGILDFTDPAESGKDSDPARPSAAARWFGYTYRENPDIWKEASPLAHVDENSPPTLFINSAIPRFHAGRDPYLKVLEKNGICHQVHTIPETPHPFWLFHPWFDETISYISDFLNIIFK